MRRLILCFMIFLLLIPSADAFERSKVIGGNFTNPLYAEIPHEYRAEWVEFTFSSNETCNASPTYRVYQYGRIIKEGKAGVRWFRNKAVVTVPLELHDEFTVHLSPNFSCKAVPSEYRIFATIDFNRLTRLEVKTEKTVKIQWNGKPVKKLPLIMDFNIPGELLGIEAELYNYRGKLAPASLSWNSMRRNFTVPVVNGRIWIPGENAGGKIRLSLDIPSNVSVSATAYYLIRRRPVNDDLLFKDGNLLRFDYPLGAMMWDEGSIRAWFLWKGGNGRVLTFDFGNDRESSIYIKGDEVCAKLYTPYTGRKKKCALFPEKKIHMLSLSLNRNPDGTRYLYIKLDGSITFEMEVDSGIRLWYLGNTRGSFSLLSFDASLRRNPDYYVIPPDERKANIALGLSAVALIVSIILNIGRLRR